MRVVLTNYFTHIVYALLDYGRLYDVLWCNYILFARVFDRDWGMYNCTMNKQAQTESAIVNMK